MMAIGAIIPQNLMLALDYFSSVKDFIPMKMPFRLLLSAMLSSWKAAIPSKILAKMALTKYFRGL
jgi:hypothetical protein